MTQKLYIGFEGGLGSALVDLSTKKLDRLSQGIHFTDDIEYALQEGEHIWVVDVDGHVGVYTKDLVLLARLDPGWDARIQPSRFNDIHVQGDYLYIVSTRLHDYPSYNYPIDLRTQRTVRRFHKFTLEPAGEFLLDHPEMWNSTDNYGYYGGYFFLGAHFWQGSTKDAGSWYKYELATGALVDTWAGGPNTNVVSYVNADASVMLSEFDYRVTPSLTNVANFVTKTLTVVDFTVLADGMAAGMFTQDDITFSNVNFYLGLGRDWPISLVQGNLLHHLIAFWRYDGPVGQQMYSQYSLVTTNLDTGKSTFTPWFDALNVPSPQASRRVHNRDYQQWCSWGGERHIVLSPTQVLLWDDFQGFLLVDLQAQTKEHFLPPWADAYSNNAPYIGTVRLMDALETSITGTVTQETVPSAGRKIYIYDDATGQKITEAVTDAQGVYTFKKFTSRPVFAVCPSLGNTMNSKIKAHLS